MTTTSAGASGQISTSASKSSRPLNAPTSSSSGSTSHHQQQRASSYLSSGSSSVAFQQVKQTQASLARLSRVYQQQQQQQQQVSHTNQSSQQVSSKESSNQPQQATARCTTFVDCLIRRFKDCFNEDCCTVPMFVVGNLSPGSDGKFRCLFVSCVRLFHSTYQSS